MLEMAISSSLVSFGMYNDDYVLDGCRVMFPFVDKKYMSCLASIENCMSFAMTSSLRPSL